MESPNLEQIIEKLSSEDLDDLITKPNGTHLIIDFCRNGRVDPQLAALAIDRFENTRPQRIRRFLLAVGGAIVGA